MLTPVWLVWRGLWKDWLCVCSCLMEHGDVCQWCCLAFLCKVSL